MFLRGRYAIGFLRSADSEGSGGGGNQPPPRETFSREYVQELREEAKGTRLKLTAAEAAAAAAATAAEQAVASAAEARAQAKKEAEEAVAAAKAEADAAKASVITAANQRIILAELKAEAIKAGMIDPDGLKLIDTSKVTIGDDGEVKIPDGFFDATKKAKPWLFGTPSSTSNTTQPPAPGNQEPKKAAEMTDAERAAALKALGVTRT